MITSNCDICKGILSIKYKDQNYEKVVRDFGLFMGTWICRPCLEQIAKKFFYSKYRINIVKILSWNEGDKFNLDSSTK